MAKHDITAERIEELLSYNAETGIFTWKPRIAGHRRSSGYVSIEIDGVEVKAHQLAWFLSHGEWPSTLIDHINGNPSDNRLCNLRDATHKINAENQRRAQKNSKSKMLGAQWNERLGKWQSAICVDGVKKHLGVFNTPEDAHAAYINAKRKMHIGCTI